MSHSVITKPTRRQGRLLAWFGDRERNVLPTREVVDWRQAGWTTSEIFAFSGIYIRGQGQACLDDLRALRAMGYLDPDCFWRLHPCPGSLR